MFEDQSSPEADNEGEISTVTPTIIQRGNHPIQEQDIDKEALKVLYRLRDAGFAGYLVGGGVRDLYLGKKPKDFDISTDARPGQLRKLFRNSRTIGRRFRLVQVFFRGGKIIEVSTLRSQSEYDIKGADKDKVLPANNTFGTLEDDAFRRDLTVNSLFYEVENHTIIDYVGGVNDLDNGIVRIIGEPNRRLTRDPVRMMRAVRHAARNGFEIDEPTWRAIVENREKLNLCPPSRIRDELLKDLRGGASRAWAELAIKTRIFFTLFPMYDHLIDGENAQRQRRDLLNLLGVLDRLNSEVDNDHQRGAIPEYMLLAVLLTPWACEHFNLVNQRLGGPAHHKLSRKIRRALDEYFGERFNLKRAAKEAIAVLFVNLPTFLQHADKKSWPKWLRKKSYFKDCSRYYAIFKEARGGPAAQKDLYIEDKPDDRVEVLTYNEPANGSRGRRGTMPAFSSKKSGVFGLRRS